MIVHKFSWMVLTICVNLVASAAVSYVKAPQVQINNTIISGLTTNAISGDGNYVTQFLGIPYAPQPVRFSPSTPYVFQDSTFDASAYGAVCIQEFVEPTTKFVEAIYNMGNPTESEDCLSLNVWTPVAQLTKSTALPVLFWLYGGSLQFGGTNQAAYNGTNLASHDVVVVTINYRTNVFGFPSGTQIPIEETNLGLLDQRLALKWVRDNIASFGGDKDRITIFGQSAGSFSVDSFILQGPADNPPFQSAILESGVLLTSRSVERGPLFNQLAQGCGCNQTNGTQAQLECLRQVPATTIKSVEENLALGFSVITDNITIFANAYDRRLSGNAAKVPIIIGTTADEGTVFTYGQTNFTDYVTKMFPGAPLSTLKELYPVPQQYATDSEAIAAAFRDVVFTCPTSITSDITAQHIAPTYRYVLDAYFDNTQIFPGARAYHASDVPLVFGTYPIAGDTSTEVSLSSFMQSTWTGFAKNPQNSPWAKLGSTSADLAALGYNGTAGVTMQTRNATDYTCKAFWDKALVPGRDISAILNY